MRNQKTLRGDSFFWDVYALLYDSINQLLPYGGLINSVLDVIENSSQGDTVLDAGCGTGNLMLNSIKRGQNFVFVGSDLSSNMLKRASSKKLLKNSYLIQINLDNPLPFKDRYFNSISSINSLYALKDPLKTLKEFYRILSFNGILVIATPRVNPSIKDILKEHFHLARRKPIKKAFKIFFKSMVHLAPISLVVFLNAFVIKKKASNKKFHFFKMSELEQAVEDIGFEIAKSTYVYAGTDLYIVAQKVASKEEKELARSKFEVKIAETDKEFRDLYNLRYKVYCTELKSLDPRDYLNKEERDAYDEQSVHIIVKDQDKVVGTLRMIRDSSLGFLMEDMFKLPKHIDRSKTVEHSRGAIAKEYRDLGIYDIMLEKAYEWQRLNRYTTCIGAPNKAKLSSMLASRGWAQIGDEAEYHGIIAIPMIYFLDNFV